MTRRERLEALETRLCNEYAELHAGLVRLGLTTEAADRVAHAYVLKRIELMPSLEAATSGPEYRWIDGLYMRSDACQSYQDS